MYRVIVLFVSGVSHYAALLAILWVAQNCTHDLKVYTLAELSFIAAGLHASAFLLIISPLGSLFQKMNLPLRQMSKREAEIVAPLLDAVMSSYRKKKRMRIMRVKLFIEDDIESNAYAFGKNNIVLTSGFYRAYCSRSDVVKGVIAHELGHLHYRDLWFQRYVAACGGALTLIHAVLACVSVLVMKFSEIFLPFSFFAFPVMALQVFMGFLVYLVRLPEMIFDMASVFLSRAQEYRADRFAADIVGVKGMASFLETVKRSESFTEVKFLTMKRRSHPPTELRLERLYERSGHKTVKMTRSVKNKKCAVSRCNDYGDFSQFA